MFRQAAILIAILSTATFVRADNGSAVVKAQAPAALRSVELDSLFGQLQSAEADKSKTIEEKIWANWSRSESVTAELLLGQASRAMAAQEYDAALTMLDELVKATPEFAEAWNRRATLYFQMRRYEQSLADIDKVLELEPRHFGALAGRGMIYMALDKPDSALAAYREALTMNPHMAGVIEAIRRLEKERPDI